MTRSRRAPSAGGAEGAWDALAAIGDDLSGGASDVARRLIAWGEAWSA